MLYILAVLNSRCMQFLYHKDSGTVSSFVGVAIWYGRMSGPHSTGTEWEENRGLNALLTVAFFPLCCQKRCLP